MADASPSLGSTAPRNAITQLSAAKVGDRVWFASEKQAYTIQARGGRYIVCTKPFNLRKTVLYTVVNLVERVRGTENLVFGHGAETREQCEAMIKRLTRFDDPTCVSYRNRIELDVLRVGPPRAVSGPDNG